jgi:hypothetical protein
VRTGAVRPSLTCTIGAGIGERGRRGAAAGGTERTSTERLSGIQVKAAPVAAALTIGWVSRRALPVATSATHSSSPAGLSTRKARRWPSGDQDGAVKRVPGASGTSARRRRPRPAATGRSATARGCWPGRCCAD